MASKAGIGEMRTAGVAAAYDRWAPIYDLVFGKVFTAGRSEAIVAAEAAGGLPSPRVLEVGVGTGISLPQYRRSTRLVGTDIADAMLDKARRRVRELRLDNVEDILVMDAEAMTFPDDHFDVVVAQYVVTACPSPEAALDEFVRVVRPGGEIVITTRIGAGTGLRGTIEKALMPLTSRLGWRTEFPWRRYEDWAAANGRVELLENRPLPPLGHFSLVRYRKRG